MNISVVAICACERIRCRLWLEDDTGCTFGCRFSYQASIDDSSFGYLEVAAVVEELLFAAYPHRALHPDSIGKHAFEAANTGVC